MILAKDIAKPVSEAAAHAEIASAVSAVQSFFEMVVHAWLPGCVPGLLFEDAGNRALYTGAFSGACRPHVETICGVVASYLGVRVTTRQHGEFNKLHRDFALRYVMEIAPLVDKYRYEPCDGEAVDQQADWVAGLECAVGHGLSVCKCSARSYLVKPKSVLLVQLDAAANLGTGYGR